MTDGGSILRRSNRKRKAASVFTPPTPLRDGEVKQINDVCLRICKSNSAWINNRMTISKSKDATHTIYFFCCHARCFFLLLPSTCSDSFSIALARPTICFPSPSSRVQRFILRRPRAFNSLFIEINRLLLSTITEYKFTQIYECVFELFFYWILLNYKLPWNPFEILQSILR